MENKYSVADLLDFLDHAADRGLMPAATAQALAVASRNVFGILTEDEQENLGEQDLATIVKRFNNKRAKDFNPSSLREYGRRVQRATNLFQRWREDPANFTVKTRSTHASRKKERGHEGDEPAEDQQQWATPRSSIGRGGTYHSAVPVRPGVVIALQNIPHDLTRAEAEKIANFVRMLAVDE